MFSFNKALELIEPSASMKLGLEANNSSLLNLSIGIPDIKPPLEVGNWVEEFSKGGSFPYISSRGTLLARQNLSQILFGEGERPDPDTEIFLTAGAKFGIYLSLKTCASFGDEVVLMEPYWLSYPAMAQSLGLKVNLWKPAVTESGELDFSLDHFEEICKKGSPKALIFNNPNNPSGKVFDNDYIEKLIDICTRYACWLLVDEVYKHHVFSFRPTEFPKAANVIRIGSLSKSLSLPGLRLGYVTGPKNFIEKADLLSQHVLTCITPISNFVAEKLTDNLFLNFIKSSVQVYSDRYDRFCSIFTDSFFILKSAASFYVLVKSKGPISESVTEHLASQFGIISTPGSAYGEMFTDFARICLTVDSSVLESKFLVK